MKTKLLNIMFVLLGLLFLNGGLNKFFNYMPVPDDLPEPISKDNEALMEIIWLIPLIAAAEILAGILILFTKTRALGALVIFPVMVGILLTHLFVAPEGLLMAILIWAVFLWILYENRQKYFALIQ